MKSSLSEKIALRGILSAAVWLLWASCGREARTSGFFAGGLTGTSPGTQSQPAARVPSDTLVNSTFTHVLDRPFGPGIPYDIQGGALQIDNLHRSDPVVLLSTAGLLRDGIVEARFHLVDVPQHGVVGLVLRASDEKNFLLLGVNSRGQYTIQECRNGLWNSVMGLDAFQRSRLLPYGMPSVLLTACVHGSYVDLEVNGQLVQVVRLRMPALGAAGVFTDGRMRVELDRFTVVPSL